MAEIRNTNSNTLLSGTIGDDSIQNGGDWNERGIIAWHYGGSNVTINSGAGNDSVYNDTSKNVKINTGEGNDFVENYGLLVTITGGNGNDSIFNNCYRKSDDSIYYFDDNEGKNVLFKYNSGDGNDIIYGFKKNSTLSISGSSYSTKKSGSDIIVTVDDGKITLVGAASLSAVNIRHVPSGVNVTNTKDSTVITGTAFADTIKNEGGWVTINAGDGNDSIYNDTIFFGIRINGDAGNDTINGSYFNNATINGGSGNDIIDIYGYGNSIFGGAGNDKITVNSAAHGNTINGGKGNDTIYNEDNYFGIFYKYSSGDGTDLIEGFGTNDTLQIGGGSYSTTKSGSDIIVTVGDGKITLVGAANLSKVNIKGKEEKKETNSWTLNGTTATYGTASKTLITVKGVKSLDGLSLKNKVVTISEASLNKKKVTISGDGYTLKLGSDVSSPTTKKAAFSLSGSTATYKSSYKTAGYTLASNSKSISYSKGTTASALATIKGASSTSGLSVSGNVITLKNSVLKNNVTVSGDYEFSFASDYKKATISGSSNADSIISYGNNLSVNGGKGNDLIRNGDSARAGGAKVSIFGGAGNDTIELWDTKTATVYGGDGNDFIDSSSLSQKILLFGGAGNDSIVNPGSNVTINGGAGNDSIYNSGANVLFKYAVGDGNDIIYGFKSDSTLSISGGEYSDKKSGKDIIVTVGEGKITLVGAASLSKINIAGTKKVTTPATLLTVTDKTKSPVTSDSAIKIVDASKRTKAVKITGNKLANSINGGTGNDTLSGGKGNDTLTGGAGKDVFIYTAGKDVITDYSAEDTISISSGSAKVTTSGSDLIFTVGNGKITVKSGADKTVTYFDSGGKHTYKKSSDDSKLITLTEDYDKETYTMGDKLRTLDASAVELDLKIVGNKFANKIIGSNQDDCIDGAGAADVITGGDGNDTLIGGKGNDTLTGGGGADLFSWSSGDGNDLITDYAEEDIVSIKGDTVKNFSASSDDIIFTLAGKSKITIASGKDKLITYIDDKGEHIYPKIFTVKDKTITLTEEYSKKRFNVSDYGEYKNINASKVTHGLNIVGNSVANSIIGTSDEDTIDGGTNNDTIRGGDGNDSISGGKGNDELYGGVGNDTLWGGAGNDYLEGGDGDDIFVFSSNEGSDTIRGYEQGLDKIMILSNEQPLLEGTPLTDDVTFNVGKGKITVLNGAHTAISFVDSKGKNLEPYIPSK